MNKETKERLLSLMRCAIFYPEDNTYRFFSKDFQDLWKDIDSKVRGEDK